MYKKSPAYAGLYKAYTMVSVITTAIHIPERERITPLMIREVLSVFTFANGIPAANSAITQTENHIHVVYRGNSLEDGLSQSISTSSP